MVYNYKRMGLKEKAEFINSLNDDLRAEYLVASFLEEGVSLKDMLVALDGELKRKWSADISSAEVESFENGEETLSIHLNRTGIYDVLPEALFHDNPEKRNATGEEMSKESRRLKAEEKQIRLFFRPFENEFFIQKVRVAMNETLELQKLHLEFLDGLIPGFWKTDKKIPSNYASKLIKLLPVVHKITGNYTLTASCLSEILEEDVHMELLSEEPGDVKSGENGGEISSFSLGRIKLGKDTVLGHHVSGFFGKLRVKIGPVKNSAVKAYFKNGPADRLLDCFYGYFVPVELDVETVVLPGKTQSRIKLPADFETGDSFLGYNTMLS